MYIYIYKRIVRKTIMIVTGNNRENAFPIPC